MKAEEYLKKKRNPCSNIIHIDDALEAVQIARKEERKLMLEAGERTINENYYSENEMKEVEARVRKETTKEIFKELKEYSGFDDFTQSKKTGDFMFLYTTWYKLKKRFLSPKGDLRSGKVREGNSEVVTSLKKELVTDTGTNARNIQGVQLSPSAPKDKEVKKK